MWGIYLKVNFELTNYTRNFDGSLISVHDFRFIMPKKLLQFRKLYFTEIFLARLRQINIMKTFLWSFSVVWASIFYNCNIAIQVQLFRSLYYNTATKFRVATPICGSPTQSFYDNTLTEITARKKCRRPSSLWLYHIIR